MNRALIRLSLACLAMFVLLLLNVNYVQAFQASSLAGKPGNIRVFDQQFQYQRGSIVAGGGLKIAVSRQVKGTSTYQRYYPFGAEYAPVTGYASIYGATGIESAENKELSGTDPRLTVHNFIDLLTGKPKLGATVYLTVNPKAQQAAYQALKAQVRADHGLPAAAVAIDPSTGAILAMASYPTFNPNAYTTLDGAKLDRIDAANRRNPAQPLLNRAINETFPPGSTFKIVTSAAAFSAGKVADQNSTVPAPTDLKLPDSNRVLINDDNEVCGDGHPPIITAFTLSCNTAFGALGMKLTSPVLRDYANRFGLNRKLSVPLDVTPSVFPRTDSAALTAYSAIGQFDDQVTPLQEAMFAATVANNGTLMTPYLVQQVQAPDLSQIQAASPSVFSQPVSTQVAGYLKQMMTSVTSDPSGTAYATANPQVAGVQIAGKTGTAQNGVNNTGLNDAVFTCFAPADSPKIAVGVIVKGGGFGADAAAPIAVKIIQAYLGVR
ncbi:MAG TPA: penicillin-binding protein 2 [Streptosporangiaceae bacterium]|jgi:peptidoglycan glycosyltransferase